MKTALLTVLAMALLPAAPVVEPDEVTFEVLAGYEYEEGMKLPGEITKLHEKKVKVSGFMATEDDSEGDVDYFIIINDACGCEGTPMMNEMVFCAMPEGETTKLLEGRVTVTGTMYVQEEKEEGVVISLYGMSVESVRAGGE